MRDSKCTSIAPANLHPAASLFTLCLLFLTGCDAWQNAYIASSTVAGVNATVSGTRQTGALVIGYDRDFATIIPSYQVQALDADNQPILRADGNPAYRREVMRVRGCSAMKTKGVNLNRYADVIATGQYARNPAAINQGNQDLITACGQFVGVDD